MSAAPIAIAAGFTVCIALVLFSVGSGMRDWLNKVSGRFNNLIDRADVKLKAGDFTLIVIAAGALLWVGAAIFFHATLLAGAFMFPVSFALAYFVGVNYLKIRGNMRVNAFVQQLEIVLRMMSGALRVGLGLRQSLILVTEEVADPARREFLRVIGRTNIGISILDALDELTKSMPSHEMSMMARSIRVQATTGGDLAHVLETVATTIKDRRRIVRKVSALTAQGRGGAFIIGALPVVVGGFVVFTQHDMAQALLHTKIGWIALGIAGGLEGLAIFSLMKILQFDA